MEEVRHSERIAKQWHVEIWSVLRCLQSLYKYSNKRMSAGYVQSAYPAVPMFIYAM